MPLFLFRDGSLRQLTVVPEDVEISTYQDRRQRQVHVLLNPQAERLLLAAQPRRRRRRAPSAPDPLQPGTHHLAA